MIGPSSSHTAGAARLGLMARTILGEPAARAVIELHGSFAQTYRGHGTDKAIVAGLMGMGADDVRIKEALRLAETENLQVIFRTVDLADAHPNTAVFRLTGVSGREVKVTGASVGGGNIVVSGIDNYAVELSGAYYTLISIHKDRPGVIAMISAVLAEDNVNIAFMRLSRRERGAQALAIFEADQPISPRALEAVKRMPAVEQAMLITPL